MKYNYEYIKKLGCDLMNNILNIDICNGISFSHIKSSKFKTAELSVTFFIPLDKKFVSGFSVLISVLSDSCKKFKNFQDLNKYTEDLYGACIDYCVSKIGEYQVLELFVSALDDRFTINNEKNIDKMADVLCDLIFDPLVENNKFDENVVSKRKSEINELIDERISDKRIWSKFRCIQLMFENEKSGIDKFGEKSDVDSLNSSSLFDFYKKLLKESRIKIMMVSNSDCSSVVDKFKAKFKDIDRKTFEFESCDSRVPSNIRSFSDKMNVQQCKLVMGFRTPFIKPTKDTHAMNLACSIFGRLPTSRLFMSVREKLNLCYYCSSNFDSSTGALFVESGVETANVEKAKEEILKQLKIISETLITDDELSDSKKFFIQSAISVSDNINNLHNWYLLQYPFNKFESPEEFAQLISKVSKQDIMNCMSQVKLDTVYILKGDE